MHDNQIRKLGGQTLIYGLGTIVPRLLNYAILTYYYTRKLEIQEYGIITELYAYISILLVVMTFGLETGYFKFSSEKNRSIVFSNCFLFLLFTSTIFILIGTVFTSKIAGWMQYDSFIEYIRWSVIIVGIDAFVNIFIAKLRIEEKILKFVIVQFINVILTIALVLYFLEKFPQFVINNPSNFISELIGNKSKVYYIFLANFVASFTRLIFLLSEIRGIRLNFNFKVIKEILIYALPLLIAQLSGTFNETIDRILLRILLPEGSDALYELGIYGANYRIAVLMTIFIQMFRYAADPFYFKNFKKENSKKLYADVFKYFVLFCLVIFLMITLYIDFFKYFIDKKFHSGLFIVPVILVASFLTGVLFNMNVWYRLTGKTYYGIFIIGSGAIITIALNIVLIPVIGYFGCAITHLISTIIMVLISYLLGKKHYNIPYELKKIAYYLVITFFIFMIGYFLRFDNLFINFLKNTIIFALFIVYIVKKENFLIIFLKNESKNSKQV